MPTRGHSSDGLSIMFKEKETQNTLYIFFWGAVKLNTTVIIPGPPKSPALHLKRKKREKY